MAQPGFPEGIKSKSVLNTAVQESIRESVITLFEDNFFVPKLLQSKAQFRHTYKHSSAQPLHMFCYMDVTDKIAHFRLTPTEFPHVTSLHCIVFRRKLSASGAMQLSKAQRVDFYATPVYVTY